MLRTASPTARPVPPPTHAPTLAQFTVCVRACMRVHASAGVCLRACVRARAAKDLGLATPPTLATTRMRRASGCTGSHTGQSAIVAPIKKVASHWSISLRTLVRQPPNPGTLFSLVRQLPAVRQLPNSGPSPTQLWSIPLVRQLPALEPWTLAQPWEGVLSDGCTAYRRKGVGVWVHR